MLRALRHGRLPLLARLRGILVGLEGRTVAIEYRWSEGRPERYAEIAAEFVRLKVDVILTVGSAVPIVKQAAPTIPIVFAVATDPVSSEPGLQVSREPGGNVTGLSIQANELAGKRIELLREVMPQLRRLAILFNADNTQPVLEMGETQAEARRLGHRNYCTRYPAGRSRSLPAFQNLKTKADAVYAAVDQLIVANRRARPRPCSRGATAHEIFSERDFVKSRSAHVLWTKLLRTVQPLGRLCGQDFARDGKPGDIHRRATDQI